MHIKKLVLLTDLPELWEMFEEIVALSPLDSNGYLTLLMARDYLEDREIPVPLNIFWKVMSYFLNRQNQAIAARRKKKEAKK